MALGYVCEICKIVVLGLEFFFCCYIISELWIFSKIHVCESFTLKSDIREFMNLNWS